jgi:ATP-binding cassette subfamily B protein
MKKEINSKKNLLDTIKILRVIYRMSKGYFYTFVIQTLIKSVFPYITIVFTYRIIDGIIDNIPETSIMIYVYWMIGLNLLLGLLDHVNNYFHESYLQELNYTLEKNIALKTFTMDYVQAEDNEVMDLIQKARDGSNGNGGIPAYLDNHISGILSGLLSIIYGVLLVLPMMTSKPTTDTSLLVSILNHPLSIFILVVVLFVPTIVNYTNMKKDNKKSYEVMIGNIDNNRRFGYFYQVCSNYKYGKDIRLFNMQEMILETMRDDKYNVETNWLGYVIFNVKLMAYSILSNQFLTFIAYAYVGLKAYYGLLTIGNVVAYVGAITLISTAITNIVRLYSKIHLFNDYLANYFTFLELESKKQYGLVDQLDYHHLTIECKDLCFTYPNQTETILNNVNLIIHPKEKLAIVGLNGAGKTTLIKLLCRLYEPTSGDILLNGISIKEYTKEVMDNLYSVVFQDFKLLSYSVKENVVGGTTVDETKVIDVLDKAGILERVNNMPDKLDTILYQRNTKNGIEISGGEAQKIAIARALYKDSGIVILDEPTAALDPKSEAEIYEKFQHLVEDKTSIFISHRMSSCQFCDRIVVVENGTITEEGSHQNLIKYDGLYKKMWEAQSKYYKENLN